MFLRCGNNFFKIVFFRKLFLQTFSWAPYKNLKRSQLRLVLFLEQGNRLLYDTDTVINLKDRVVSNAQRTPCGQFQLQGKAEDVPQLGKMIFGTLATSLKTDSLKVHTLT